MFTKAHLNVSFQSVDLKTGSIYKSSSINPFHYVPQTNCVLVNRTSRKISTDTIWTSALVDKIKQSKGKR